MSSWRDYRCWTLEEQVAQLFMVGYEGLQPNPITQRFLERGVGGLIFFRDNFDPHENAQTVVNRLQQLNSRIPAHLPRPLLGIDQEGGQVERLPHTWFPTMLTPLAVALSPQPEPLARTMYAQLAQALVQVGFNLNFFPTLDVNLNPKNPIIGVRSFGDTPKTVWELSQIALQSFEAAGLIAVGKHFPGHGNGTVDSHLDLPTLNFTLDELWPFQQAIQAGLPTMLVAHGFYPALQTTEQERSLPSSASPAIIQGVLRQKCGFNGVLITDDMCMGAITKHRSPVEAALAALKAGVDILLYKQSTDDEWAVYEAVVAAFQDGALPLTQLHQSLERIIKLKQAYLERPQAPFQPDVFSPKACQTQAEAIARQGIQILVGTLDVLPAPKQAKVLLIHPDRSTMGNYAFDVPTSQPLEQLAREAGFAQLESQTYPPRSEFNVVDVSSAINAQPDVVVFVTFNPLIYASQVTLYQTLQQQFPCAPIVLVSAGAADGRETMPNPALHLSLCSYRPASMQALVEYLASGPQVTTASASALQPQAVAEQS